MLLPTRTRKTFGVNIFSLFKPNTWNLTELSCIETTGKLIDVFSPRPHVSGDFCIRNVFYADTKISASTRSVYESYTTVHTYPIRIRTSQRISQISRGKRLVLILWRQRIQKYTDTSVHTYPDTQRIQKSPDTPSVYGGHVWTLGTQLPSRWFLWKKKKKRKASIFLPTRNKSPGGFRGTSQRGKGWHSSSESFSLRNVEEYVR